MSFVAWVTFMTLGNPGDTTINPGDAHGFEVGTGQAWGSTGGAEGKTWAVRRQDGHWGGKWGRTRKAEGKGGNPLGRTKTQECRIDR